MSHPSPATDSGPAGAIWRLGDDAAGAYAIHRIALEHAPAGMVRPDSLASIARHSGSDGAMLGCYLDNGTLIAYGLLALRAPVVDELADKLGVGASRLCVLDGAAALPQYRGFGLHHAAIERRLAHALACGSALAAATVAPANLRALRSLLRAGLRIRGFAPMYGTLPRLIMQRDLQQPEPAPAPVCRVPAGDIAAHSAALAEGLTGYACERHADGPWRVLYGRAVQAPSSPSSP
jgi:hypothetical protein